MQVGVHFKDKKQTFIDWKVHKGFAFLIRSMLLKLKNNSEATEAPIRNW